MVQPAKLILFTFSAGIEATKMSAFSEKWGTLPLSIRKVNSRFSLATIGRFAPSGSPSCFPRIIELLPRKKPSSPVTSTRGFTLAEIMMVLILLGLVMIPAWRIWRSGTTRSMRKMLQVQTVLEAQQVLRQIHDDLSRLCGPFVNPYFNIPTHDFLDLRSRFTACHARFSTLPGGDPIKFFNFPMHGSVEQAAKHFATGTMRLASRIEYSLEQNTSRPLFHRLIRREIFHPDHPMARQYPPDGTRQTVMSERVNFFRIRPLFYPTDICPNNDRLCFFVDLQLVDSFQKELTAAELARLAGPHQDSQQFGIVLADFFDVATSEWFTRSQLFYYQRWPWHLDVSCPDP